jgi:hypothetical protein
MQTPKSANNQEDNFVDAQSGQKYYYQQRFDDEQLELGLDIALGEPSR